jgi:cell division septation protein DedD
MGKDVNKNFRKLNILFLSFLLLLLSSKNISAVDEHELFNTAYDYYLSYQPEKAIEEFRKFLNDFPNSSAKDAALYWLGKSLMQLDSYDEAEKVFNDLRTNFPDSLFIKFANRELNAINNKRKIVLAEKPPDIKPAIEKKPEEKISKEEKTGPTISVPKEKEEPKEIKGIVQEYTKTKEVEKSQIAKGSKRYLLQAGTFKNKSGANKLSNNLRKYGFKSYIIETTKDNTPLYIVTAGGFESKEKANESAKKIRKKLGIDVLIKDTEKILLAKATKKPEIKEEEHIKKDSLEADKLKTETKPEEKTELKDNTKIENIVITSEQGINLKERTELPQSSSTEVKDTQKPINATETDKLKPETKTEITEKEEKTTDLFIDIRTIPEEKKEDTSEIKESEDIEEITEDEETDKKEEKETSPNKEVEKIAAISKPFDYKFLPEEYKNILKLGALWKTGNPKEDLIVEEELIKIAKKQDKNIEVESYNKLIKDYNLSEKESEDLYKELIIGKLIENELKNLLEESWVELISVKYTDKDKYTKIVIAPELQNQAKSGKKFEEIYKMYPEYITYKITTIDKLDEKLKEKSKYLSINEIGVIWDKNGYTIIKLTKENFDIRNLENMDQKNKEQIKDYIKQWINRLISKKT